MKDRRKSEWRNRKIKIRDYSVSTIKIALDNNYWNSTLITSFYTKFVHLYDIFVYIRVYIKVHFFGSEIIYWSKYKYVSSKNESVAIKVDKKRDRSTLDK